MQLGRERRSRGGGERRYRRAREEIEIYGFRSLEITADLRLKFLIKKKEKKKTTIYKKIACKPQV